MPRTTGPAGGRRRSTAWGHYRATSRPQTTPAAGLSQRAADRSRPASGARMVGGMTSSSGTSDPAIPPPAPVTRHRAQPRGPAGRRARGARVRARGVGGDADLRRRPPVPRPGGPASLRGGPGRGGRRAARPGGGAPGARVVFVVYAQQPAPAARAADALVVRGFRAVGIDVLDVLRADRHRWHPLLRPRPGTAPRACPTTSARTRSPRRRCSTAGSRWARAPSWPRPSTPHPERVAALAAARASPPRRSRGDDERWARDLVRRCVTGAEVPGDEEVARLLVAVGRPGPRAAVWALMTRTVAPAHVGFWTDVVRRAPDDLLATPAALLAFAAWLAGHGALAWCAVDRSQAVQPDHALAARVAGLLVDAVAPHEWEERRPPGGGGGPRSGERGWPRRRGPPPVAHAEETARRDLGCVTWAKRYRHRSSRGPTAPGTARRSAGASTCSRGCCARPASTPTTR